MANEFPNEKPLRAASFVIHATRGIIRDHNTRRKAMFILLVVALVLLLSGSTFLQELLNHHEHPICFIVFWLTCGWLTLTAMLLAIFDMLIVRLEARRAQRALRERLKSAEATPD
jgi:protein-S-isoprenylcysteine O-methyltransferase Ste14